MALSLYQFDQDNQTANFPTTSAVTINRGANINGGSLESILVRGDITFGADPTSAGIGSLYTSVRFTLNGNVIFSYTGAGAAQGNDTNGPDAFGYFLNSIGGGLVEAPIGTTTREFYITIPVGMNLSDSVNRLEWTISYGATGTSATPSSGSVSVWGRYNDAISNSTIVAPATSFSHTNGAVEQVIVKTGSYDGYKVAGIMVSNDSSADEIGSQGIRVVALGPYGMEPAMWRQFNGDAMNGVMYADNDVSTTELQYANGVDGVLFLPTLGLDGGDIYLVVDSSATTTRLYTPLLVASVNGGSEKVAKQTQKVGASTTASILRKVEE